MCPKATVSWCFSQSTCTRDRVASICVAAARRGLSGQQRRGVLLHTHQPPHTVVQKGSSRPSLFKTATLARVAVRNGPFRSLSVRIHDRTNDRLSEVYQSCLLPVARVVSTLLHTLHTLQDQRMSLAKIWNA